MLLVARRAFFRGLLVSWSLVNIHSALSGPNCNGMEMGSTEAVQSMMTAAEDVSVKSAEFLDVSSSQLTCSMMSRWELDPPCTEAVSLRGQVPC